MKQWPPIVCLKVRCRRSLLFSPYKEKSLDQGCSTSIVIWDNEQIGGMSNERPLGRALPTIPQLEGGLLKHRS